ncbi:hypothetical protein ACFOTA_06380 [Chitinophaga sp. GCM10012297]|uniref:Uncharacterized protein n=1 Tax=Chitinophaga chungangae TaxID=2821488 RepID=A0ABS3YAZ3_9BACT|nr:hypothetical protein [Chitinophaga chungangae]MBO9151826.1 hypothetical protein [Chitinophaga chungangae]
MLTEPVHENIFPENEFVETRFRAKLLTGWVKAGTGMSVFLSGLIVIAYLWSLFNSLFLFCKTYTYF